MNTLYIIAYVLIALIIFGYPILSGDRSVKDGTPIVILFLAIFWGPLLAIAIPIGMMVLFIVGIEKIHDFFSTGYLLQCYKMADYWDKKKKLKTQAAPETKVEPDIENSYRDMNCTGCGKAL